MKTILSIFTLVILATPCLADVLYMKNGDRLTGEVVTKAEDTLKFKTPYGGPFEIKWEEVEKIESDEDMTLLLTDGTKESSRSLQPSNLPEIEFVNPEPWRLGEAWHFTGDIKLALEFERGNTDTDEYEIATKMTIRKLKHRFRIDGNYENDRANGEKTSDEGKFKAKYDYLLGKRTYVGALVGAERDDFADLQRRVILGPFLGYKIFHSEIQTWEIELGVSWIDEEYSKQPDDEYTAVSWDIDYKRQLFPDRLDVYADSDGFLNTEQPSRVISRSTVGLEMPIGWGLKTGTEVYLDYDSDPSDDAERLDTTYRVNIGYGW